MSDKIEKQLEEITSAVVESKESTAGEIKDLNNTIEKQNETIEKLQDEVAEVKANGVNMPVETKKDELEVAKKNFWSVAKTGKDEKGMPVETIVNEKSITTGSTGVQDQIVEELAASILIPAQEAYALVQDMGVETVSSVDYSRIVQVGRSTAVWGSENTSNTAPSTNGGPTFVKISAKFAKLTVDNFITNEAALDPKYDLESFLINDTRVEAGRVMAQGFIDGDGAGNNPKGLLAHFDATESVKGDDTRNKDTFGSIECTTGGGLPTDDQELIDLLKDLEISLLTPYQANAKFYVNKETFKRLSQMKDANNVHYLQADLSGKAKGFLFGYPVKVEPFLQDAATVGNHPIIFGDLSVGFKRINYVGMTMLRNPYLVPGNVNYHWEMRVGTIVGDSNAVKSVIIAASA